MSIKIKMTQKNLNNYFSISSKSFNNNSIDSEDDDSMSLRLSQSTINFSQSNDNNNLEIINHENESQYVKTNLDNDPATSTIAFHKGLKPIQPKLKISVS